MPQETIRVRGARQHNLKNISVDLPRNKLVVITGPSGSGKSSLAFDTLFAEGQRKYVESLSAFARQFLDQLPRPEVDHVEGLSPAIAIEQRASAGRPRTTVATTTEIYDYLRLVFAQAARAHDPESGAPMAAQSEQELVDELLALPEKSRVALLGPLREGAPEDPRGLLDRLMRDGFARARVDGRMVELAGGPAGWPASAQQVDVVVDRLILAPGVKPRLADSVEAALKAGGGRMRALVQSPGPPGGSAGDWRELVRSTRMFSPVTGKSYEPPTPRHFSFNSPLGACPACDGLGQRLEVDPDLVVPDPARTLEEGALAPLRRVGGARLSAPWRNEVEAEARRLGAPPDQSWAALPEAVRETLLRGAGAAAPRPFEGVIPALARMYVEAESDSLKAQIRGYMTGRPCGACGGRRLKPESLAATLASGEFPDATTRCGAVVIPGLSIADLCALPVDGAERFLSGLTAPAGSNKIVADLIAQVVTRLGFLRELGLGYLALDRESGTLSGGEAQRLRLATQVGAGLSGVLYVLDEPSIGLHPRDNGRLLDALRRLRDLGNTVVVVEHDEETIRSADYVVELGPGAGALGGEVVVQGALDDVLAHSRSLTGAYLRGDLKATAPAARPGPAGFRGWIEVAGARAHNLKGVTARFPVGLLTCVTGVSGSGKSTLVNGVLRRAAERRWRTSAEPPGEHAGIAGWDAFDQCVVVDQSAIGRTGRSNPATFTGMFNHIRELFAALPASRVRGFDAARFSFNLRGGRCEKCEGEGVRRLEMQFLPPAHVVCEACGGARYNRETLEIAYKGRNIAQTLDLTVDEAAVFFRAQPRLAEACRGLASVGLGYLRLGQSAITLSGGEAQRLKLAAELGRRQTGRTLYLLDEPTTGLHFHDVAKLLEALFQLRDAGNTLIVVEHNLEVVSLADWVIDLGPEGGAAGGEIVAEGPPEWIAASVRSHTGRFLARRWAGGQPAERQP